MFVWLDNFWDDDKTAERFAKELNISAPAAIGHLVSLWRWCADNSTDGELPVMDMETVAMVAIWTGNPKVFYRTLMHFGILDMYGRCSGWDASIRAHLNFERERIKKRKRALEDSAKQE